jgi:tetratricopeptide (TPR) repeat protein
VLLSLVLWGHGDRRGSDEHQAHAVELVEGLPLSPTKARVLARSARTAFLTGDPALGLELAQDALPAIEQLGEPEFLSHVVNTVGMARVSLGDPGGIDDLRRSCELAEAAKSPDLVHSALNNLANMLWRLGRLDEATTALDQAEAANERYGYGGGLRWLPGERMLDRWLRGDLVSAREIADQVIADASRSAHYHEAPARCVRATVSLARGDVDAALADSERIMTLAQEVGEAQVIGPALVTRAQVLHAAGRLDEANSLVDGVLREHDLADPFQHELPLLVAELGRSAELLAALAEEKAPTPWINAARAIASGDYGQGAEVYSAIGSRVLEARARLLRAEALIAGGRRADADAELGRALPSFRAVGASSYLRRGEALLAATA